MMLVTIWAQEKISSPFLKNIVHAHTLIIKAEGEEERSRLRHSESISLAEDLYKKEEQVGNKTKAVFSPEFCTHGVGILAYNISCVI